MSRRYTNKKKIINDPIYGFINISGEFLFDIIEHPYFQRLRRIKQLGLTHLVYPGAYHTRFHHSLGAMHLMQQALQVLRSKGHHISAEEELSSLLAILLHDVGHGPFSHALEHSLVNGTSHEFISQLVMKRLNHLYGGRLERTIAIFNRTYKRAFFAQLISGQLDVDRLDYLSRDSFFTGVSEGVVGTERILKMLELSGDQLVAEEKAIYSLEKFLVARRLMYWQVYLHKTVLAAEYMLVLVLQRAKYLAQKGAKLFGSQALLFFLQQNPGKADFENKEEVLENFMLLDDYDVISAIKEWMRHEDRILRFLSTSLMHRRLYRCEMSATPFEYFYVLDIQKKIRERFGIKEEEMKYFFVSSSTSNFTYDTHHDNINILTKDLKVKDITEVSDPMNISVSARPVTKYFVCFPKEILH